MRHLPAPERFLLRFTEVESPDGFDQPCWQWDVLGSEGYGSFHDGRPGLAHRWSYEHHVGPIPAGLVIDHLCRNRGCVNPAHLEPVTDRVNSLRGARGTVVAHLQNKCTKGHRFTPENTKWQYRNGRRQRACRECIRTRRRARAAALRADASREAS